MDGLYFTLINSIVISGLCQGINMVDFNKKYAGKLILLLGEIPVSEKKIIIMKNINNVSRFITP